MKKLVRRLILLLTLACASHLHAHSLHQSTGEIEWNAETKKLEVSLTVFINDLELALIRHAEKLLFLDKTPAAEFDAAVLTYLAKTFIVTNDQGVSAEIEWVGRELETESAKSGDPAVTLFFEVPLPEGLDGYSLQHLVLCELFKEQTNLILLRAGTEATQLKFESGDGAKKLGQA